MCAIAPLRQIGTPDSGSMPESTFQVCQLHKGDTLVEKRKRWHNPLILIWSPTLAYRVGSSCERPCVNMALPSDEPPAKSRSHAMPFGFPFGGNHKRALLPVQATRQPHGHLCQSDIVRSAFKRPAVRHRSLRSRGSRSLVDLLMIFRRFFYRFLGVCNARRGTNLVTEVCNGKNIS